MKWSIFEESSKTYFMFLIYFVIDDSFAEIIREVALI